ncbi:MAG: hypothetical protein KF836_12300 [Fimbriimonadaceae bacterium]|nr:hypothetical protein [Fimbriimonadaceae bacterium]
MIWILFGHAAGTLVAGMALNKLFPNIIFAILTASVGFILLLQKVVEIKFSPSTNEVFVNGVLRGECDKLMLLEEKASLGSKLSIFTTDELIHSATYTSKKQIAELKALIESYLPPIEERIENMGEWHEAN